MEKRRRKSKRQTESDEVSRIQSDDEDEEDDEEDEGGSRIQRGRYGRSVRMNNLLDTTRLTSGPGGTALGDRQATSVGAEFHWRTGHTASRQTRSWPRKKREIKKERSKKKTMGNKNLLNQFKFFDLSKLMLLQARSLENRPSWQSFPSAPCEIPSLIFISTINSCQ